MKGEDEGEITELIVLSPECHGKEFIFYPIGDREPIETLRKM